MTTITGRMLNSQERQLLSMPGCVGVASELVSFAPEYRGIVENLLGRTVVAENLDAGIEIMRRGHHAFRLVTLEGDVMHSGGSMTGGSSASRMTSLLSREREIKEHEALLEKIDAQIKDYEARLERGENVVLDIDVQGALNVIASEKEKVSIFILPPSMKELRARLTGRGTETEEDVERRLANAVWEISQKDHYEYKVINDNLEECARTLQAIIKAEKHASAYYSVEVPEE
jgi:guanylate kinase